VTAMASPGSSRGGAAGWQREEAAWWRREEASWVAARGGRLGGGARRQLGRSAARGWVVALWLRETALGGNEKLSMFGAVTPSGPGQKFGRVRSG
jgi:hypothetical protein